MQDLAYRARPILRKPPRVLTVTGQGVSLRVRGHELQVTDGFPLERRQETRRVTRATSRLQRLLFLAGSGYVTVSALDWCAENGVPVVAMRQGAGPRWTLLPGTGGGYQAALRRAQALAPFTAAGLEIARWLVQCKVEGQRDVLRDLAGRLGHLPRHAWSQTAVPGAPAAALEILLPRVERAATIPALRQVEAEAADVYWAGWCGLPLHFAPPSYAKRVLPHWLNATGRGSPLNNGNRNAADPVNALLNYAYALLEAETHIACQEAGLDPYLGILHTDTDTRRSIVYDVMEPVRPVADRLVLTLLLSHVFRPGELHLLSDGRARLDQDLCARLWPWMPEFRRALGPVMVFLLGRLRRGPRYGERTAYRLVETAPPVRTRAPLGQKRWAREASPPAIRLAGAGVCRSCGVLLEGADRDRLFCPHCGAKRREETIASAGEAGREALSRLRREGRDVAHGGAAARRRGAKIGRSNRERARWKASADGAISPEVFRREILPRLRRLSVAQIARALGVSQGYASFIRRGLQVPHPRHWEVLRTLTQEQTPVTGRGKQ